MPSPDRPEHPLSHSTPWSSDELQRYSRHLLLPEVGEVGQAKLRAGSVLVVGAGGLGSPAALYLAAAGVGTLGIIDDDVVELTNLQRQILHSSDGVGVAKTESARRRLAAHNPQVNVRAIDNRVTSANALELFRPFDVIIDGTDNFATRYLVNDACILLGKPCVYASVLRFEGQSTVFGLPSAPCYRCLFPSPPPAGPYRIALKPVSWASCLGCWALYKRRKPSRSYSG